MRRIVSVSLISALLCISSAALAKVIDDAKAFVGKKSDALLSAWGEPQRRDRMPPLLGGDILWSYTRKKAKDEMPADKDAASVSDTVNIMFTIDADDNLIKSAEER